jgi:hypothetical protein
VNYENFDIIDTLKRAYWKLTTKTIISYSKLNAARAAGFIPVFAQRVVADANKDSHIILLLKELSFPQFIRQWVIVQWAERRLVA